MPRARGESIAAAVAEGHGQLRMVAVSDLCESPFNPRKHQGDAGRMAELEASVREKGILQPILARPVASTGASGLAYHALEVVYGHRRLRAAQAVGLEEVPAIVREMSDVEALEAQLVENRDREDVHPLDEADGYRRLLDQHGYDVETLMAHLGVSRTHAYTRLQLCKLIPEAREACYEGKLSASVAQLVARIPTSLQLQALQDVSLAPRTGEPMSYREALQHVQAKFMLRLGEAPFSLTSAELVAEAGACNACPKRTGAQRELFDDVSSPDVCTDPACYRTKLEAHWVEATAAARERGQRVLTLKETEKVFPYAHNPDYATGGFESVDGTTYSYGNKNRRTYRQLLAKVIKDDPTVVVLAQGLDGKTRELLQTKDVARLMKKAGFSENPRQKDRPRATPAKSTPKESPQKRAEREAEEAKARRALLELTEFHKELGRRLEAVVAGKLSPKLEAALWEVAGRILCGVDVGGYWPDSVFDELEDGVPLPPVHARLFEGGAKAGREAQLGKGKKLGSRDVLGLLLESQIIFAGSDPKGFNKRGLKVALDVAKAAGIDLKAVAKVAAGKVLEQTVKEANAKPQVKGKSARKAARKPAA